MPLHPSTVAALRSYVTCRDELCPQPRVASFFVSTAGTRLIHTDINAVFRRLVTHAQLERPGARRPRPHDFRHTFAVRVLLGWYHSGVDVQARIPSLSTYLGHVNPAATYWYLSAVPELLALASERLETSVAERP